MKILRIYPPGCHLPLASYYQGDKHDTSHEHASSWVLNSSFSGLLAIITMPDGETRTYRGMAFSESVKP